MGSAVADLTTPTPVTAAQPDPLTEPATAAPARLVVIDKLRGLVIVLMVLDHVRDFFHVGADRFSPTDLAQTTAALFATRWVTHLCAPTFVLLAGVSVRLQWARGKRGWPLSRFLLTRGTWLVVLEVTFVTAAFTFAWPFTFPCHGALLQVIWAIGAAMVLLAALVWAPPRALLALGLGVVAGHDLFDGVDAKDLGSLAPLWTLTLAPGVIHAPGFAAAYVAYPVLPWFGIMAVGVGVGDLFQQLPARRNRILLASGLGLLAGFAVLRAGNVYGDPAPWTAQPDATRTVLSFLKVSKYPPSLLYTMATLGITLSLAPLVERIGGPPGRALHVFGRTPLFTYLAHLYLARGLAVLLALAEGLSPGIFAAHHGTIEAGWGVGLPGVYLAWLVVLLVLWPLSTWFAGVKARRRAWWLSYL